VAFISIVAEEPVGINVVKLLQRVIALDLVALATGDVESYRSPLAFVRSDFGREAAA
jgi:hypothetical protein